MIIHYVWWPEIGASHAFNPKNLGQCGSPSLKILLDTPIDSLSARGLRSRTTPFLLQTLGVSWSLGGSKYLNPELLSSATDCFRCRLLVWRTAIGSLGYIYIYWLVVSTPLKNISHWERLSHILWKIKNVWNHQPVYIYIYIDISAHIFYTNRYTLAYFTHASSKHVLFNHTHTHTHLYLSLSPSLSIII